MDTDPRSNKNVQVESYKSKLCLHFFYALWIQLIDIPISLSFTVDNESEPDLDIKETRSML